MGVCEGHSSDSAQIYVGFQSFPALWKTGLAFPCYMNKNSILGIRFQHSKGESKAIMLYNDYARGKS
ncbi:hypothetical protein SADUNF_Sadunf16G0188100 [Salix dunnii]|uniref:Uncharacterized protein n=1 Tax=Salix dunnii TaxID=1413687 RepID=A0A835JAQ6_9ROSI|nr:hypothetical protein SADUNF_Sadunf16G0188100 [Salix dunnii]